MSDLVKKGGPTLRQLERSYAPRFGGNALGVDDELTELGI